MIGNILELLKYADNGSERIRIAKGKYKLPTTLRGLFVQAKKEYKWKLESNS